MTLLAHAGDVQLYLLVTGIAFFLTYRFVQGTLPDEGEKRR